MENNDHEQSVYSSGSSLCSDSNSFDPLYNVNELLNTRLIKSIQDDDFAYTKRLMRMGANPNVTCPTNLWLRSGAETVEEVATQSLPLNIFTNVPCFHNVEFTLPAVRSDGMEHNCQSVIELTSQLEWTALHAASARAQHHCVQLLLAAGADVSAQDLLHRTPLDVAGLAHYLGHKIDVDSFMETVDLLMKAGGKFLKCCDESALDTPLHTAVELGSEAAVEKMLQCGAYATAWNSRGLTAMHMCVENRNATLLQLLASHKSSNDGSNLASIDVADRNGRTVLCAAVISKWLQGLRIALIAGATNIEATHRYFDCDETTVFHLAAEEGSTDILEQLLDFCRPEEKGRIINMFDRLDPPIYYAVCNNHADCVKLLICKGAKVDILVEGNFGINGIPLLSLVVCNRNTKIAEMIMQHDNGTVKVSNSSGQSPLYIACRIRDKRMISLLLQNGADLTGGENEKTEVPLKMLMKTISKPTEFMQAIFDSNITSLQSEDDALVDFTVLSPGCGRRKMKVLQLLLDTGNAYGQQRLLLHPLVQSFLYFQWRSILPFFYIILALHVCFVLSLNVFALSLFWYKDKKMEPVPIVFRTSAWIYVIYLTTFLLTIQEIIVIKRKTIRYRLCIETTVKCFSTIFALVLPLVASWGSEISSEWVRLFGSATLLLTWVRMMYLLSRLPEWGYYILMYGKVAIKVFKILLSFVFLIFGFCVSFMIQFHAQPPFVDPLSSLLTTMVMMSSEFDYNEIMNKKRVEHASASLIMIRLIFVSFLILVPIILMNLLVGVAVNDVSTLEVIGNINRLKKQVQFIKSFEDTDYNHFIKKILPTCLYQRWFVDKTSVTLRIHRLFPRKYNYGLPTHLLEAIFENVLSQKKQWNEKQSTKLHDTKLDEIHEVIVNKNTCVPANPDIPDNTMNQVLEEIIKLRTGMKLIKNRIVKISRCSRCSYHRKVLLKTSNRH